MSQEALILKTLQTAEGFEGKAYEMDGPMIDKLRKAGQIAIGYVAQHAISFDVLDPQKNTADQQYLELCNENGYQASIDEERHSNVLQLKDPLDPSLYERTLTSYVGFLMRYQTQL